MNNYAPSEILINATLVNPLDYAEIFEFVLNEELYVIECVRVESLAEGIVFPIDNFQKTLNETLFELNHVRVNPRVDNTFIINKLTQSLQNIGVGVSNPPNQDHMAMCFKPLGEISENVRFYFTETAKCVFLSPNVKLTVIKDNYPKILKNRPTL